MTPKLLLRITAVLEGATALGFLVVPSLPSALLFGEAPQVGLGAILGRFVRALMLSLAIVCWLAGNDATSSAARGVVKAVLVYDQVATVLLAYSRLGLGLGGIVLWPAVAVHVALAVWCAMALQRK